MVTRHHRHPPMPGTARARSGLAGSTPGQFAAEIFAADLQHLSDAELRARHDSFFSLARNTAASQVHRDIARALASRCWLCAYARGAMWTRPAPIASQIDLPVEFQAEFERQAEAHEPSLPPTGSEPVNVASSDILLDPFAGERRGV